MRRWLSISLFGAFACSSTPDSSARIPAPPEEIEHIGAVTIAGDGKWLTSTPLLPVDDVHGFTGPIEPSPDGAVLQLVGYTDDQLDACHSGEAFRLPASPLALATSEVLRLPEPAWTAEGLWQEGFVDVERGGTPSAMTSPWLTGGLQCHAIHSFEITAMESFTTTETMRYILTGSDNRIDIFGDLGGRYTIDPETLAMTLVSEGSPPNVYSGGFIDRFNTIWMFGLDGRLERIPRNGPTEVVMVDGPWVGAARVWADGGVHDGVLEMVTIDSNRAVRHYDGSTWRKLRDARPRAGRDSIQGADVLLRGPRDFYLVNDGDPSVYRVLRGVETSSVVALLDTESPRTLVDTERYGLVTGTRVGALFNTVDGSTWSLLSPQVAERAALHIFDFGDALVVGGHRGDFRFVVGGLDECSQTRLIDAQSSVAAKVDDRLIVVGQRPARPDEIRLSARLSFEPIGCPHID